MSGVKSRTSASSRKEPSSSTQNSQGTHPPCTSVDSSATDNSALEIEVLLHAQVTPFREEANLKPLSVKQLQPLKKTVLNYSPVLADPTFPVSYPDNVKPLLKSLMAGRTMHIPIPHHPM
jgi:hypothetical protein